MRCPECMKFRSMEPAEPEVNDLTVSAEFNESGDVNCTVNVTDVHIALNCAECGSEMKTADLEHESQFQLVHAEMEKHLVKNCKNGAWEFKDGCELEISEEGIEAVDRTEGKGRGLKTFYGAAIEYSVHCTCAPTEQLWSETLTTDVQASSMDEAG